MDRNTSLFFIKNFKMIVHKIKTRIYYLNTFYIDAKKMRSFYVVVFKKILKQLVLNLLLIYIVFYVNNVFIGKFKAINIPIDLNLFANMILAGISIAGVFLALYCANLTSIYSTKYANAPDSVAVIFEDDILTNKNINNISNYIIFSFLLILIILLKKEMPVTGMLVFFCYSIWMVISFGLIGNKRLRLADTYGISNVLYKDILRLINNATSQGIFFKDQNFQFYYQKVCDIKLI